MQQVESLQAARILIVDDQEANVQLLERILKRTGYTCITSTTDAREAISRYVEVQPDIVLLDLMMPHLDGFQVMESLMPLIPAGSYLPILVLTADISPSAKQRALSIGAMDFVTKPFDPSEVLLRIKNLLETRFLHLQLQEHNQLLEEKVRERTQELEEAQIEILERLARAAEYRDDQTGQHTQRVGNTSAILARALGMVESQVELMRRAAPLHDVGKIAVPDEILLKPDKLTPQEFEIIKTHTTVGAALLSKGRSAFTRAAERIALTHHERWDGRGYPQGLQGEEIPIEGRIVAVVDVFDALTHERPYKHAWTLEEALEEIKRQSGQHFDPRVVEAFLSVVWRPDSHTQDSQDHIHVSEQTSYPQL
ncbi:MAG TPA: HD domain-containing phosphohydrolase [Chloroflexia bacterium]|nr:HD domain-containing phosphohydrolase [Chloroflexia bacterium]